MGLRSLDSIEMVSVTLEGMWGTGGGNTTGVRMLNTIKWLRVGFVEKFGERMKWDVSHRKRK